MDEPNFIYMWTWGKINKYIMQCLYQKFIIKTMILSVELNFWKDLIGMQKSIHGSGRKIVIK
jgi:hypothetical protein